MFQIGDVLVSDSILEERFLCVLESCQGGCCADGDSGAPLAEDETELLRDSFDAVKPYMTSEGSAVVGRKGFFTTDPHFGAVTPSMSGGLCAYGFWNQEGIAFCAIEAAWKDGKLAFRKPVSCHLFPIIARKSRYERGVEYLNYEPRQDLCSAACAEGEKRKMPVYEFLAEAIARKYGEDFVQELREEAGRRHGS